jgi:DNA-binding MarR family transcriptional regulator
LPSQVLSTQEKEQQLLESRLAAWLPFLRAHAAITRELSTRLEAQHGLTLSDFDVLVQLYFAPQHSLRRIDIARTVLLSASGVTRLLDGLERAGWVEKARCDTDARVTYAVLTAEGRAKFEAAQDSHVADIEELFNAHFDTDERQTLATLLNRLPLAETACSGDEAAAE